MQHLAAAAGHDRLCMPHQTTQIDCESASYTKSGQSDSRTVIESVAALHESDIQMRTGLRIGQIEHLEID
jgi:hypothetical protein